MKRTVYLVLAIIIVFCALAGCTTGQKNQTGDASASEGEEHKKIEVDEGLFDVTLTIPKDFVGSATQEELDKAAKEKGFTSITLNSDGSATYVMTKSKHKEIIAETAENINQSLREIVGSEDYPNITNVTANADYTRFTITTKNSTPDLSESLAAISMYMYGGMYAAFSGNKDVVIYVDYVNASSGSIIRSVNSSSMGS